MTGMFSRGQCNGVIGRYWSESTSGGMYCQNLREKNGSRIQLFDVKNSDGGVGLGRRALYKIKNCSLPL